LAAAGDGDNITMTSTNLEVAGDMMCCASCGIAEGGDIKLKTCTACKSVRYCGFKCQKEHRPQHKKECKKRTAELRDEVLFKQPKSNYYGDCPICCLPLPIDCSKTIRSACCSKIICQGCSYANQVRQSEQSLVRKCPFCRHPTPKSLQESVRNTMKRVEANDPVAMNDMGMTLYDKGDFKGAFEYMSMAAGLGDAGAHYNLSCFYRDGVGVEKDKKKELHHLEEAAIGGYTNARNNLGCVEENNGRRVRAIKHWSIAAKLGNDGALQSLKDAYGKGYISKEDFASALRGHQAAVDATKSPHREEAEAALQKLEATGAV
jgi:TPR repeat protein